MTDLKILRNALEGLRPKLAEAYRNNDEAKIKELSALEKSVMQQIKEAETEQEKQAKEQKSNPLAAFEYSPTLAVHIDRSKPEMGTEAEIKARIERLKTYPKRQDGEELSEQEIADKKWRKDSLLEPISGANSAAWLSNLQVAAGTGAEVTVGTAELAKHLQNNRTSGAFAHIVTGEGGNNHFVTFDKKVGASGKVAITYVDSNGDLMPPAERAALEKCFPGVEVKYLNRDGHKIGEEQAKTNQSGILRVQFDEHNCGLYTTHFVNMFNAAGGDVAAIKSGVANIKEISQNPLVHREIMANVLKEIAHNPEQEAKIQAGFAANSQIPRQKGESQSIINATSATLNFPAGLIKESEQKLSGEGAVERPASQVR